MSNIYAIFRPRMVKRTDGELVQSGGNRYALFISEKIIAEKEFQRAFLKGLTEQEVAQSITEAGKEVSLCGSCILPKNMNFPEIITEYSDGINEILEDETTNTQLYAVFRPRMVKRKDGSLIQSGGNRYALFFSEDYISEKEFYDLFTIHNWSEKEVAQLLTKQGKKVLLGGSFILCKNIELPEDITQYSGMTKPQVKKIGSIFKNE